MTCDSVTSLAHASESDICICTEIVCSARLRAWLPEITAIFAVSQERAIKRWRNHRESTIPRVPECTH